MVQKDLKAFYRDQQTNKMAGNVASKLEPLDFQVLDALADSGFEPSKELVQTLRNTICEFFKIESHEEEDWVPAFVQRAVKRLAVPMLYAL